MLAAAVAALADAGVTVVNISPTFATAPIGPATRRFANAAAKIESALPPLALLALLKQVEHDFGRRRGQRWGNRVLDLDIIGWSGGQWMSPTLSIPHQLWHERRFVLDPLARIAPDWHAPGQRLRVRHRLAQLMRAIPVDHFPTRA